MLSPRFVLVLSAGQNTLRAALATRDSNIVGSAHQQFQVTGSTFDPAEVWYKTKKVIAACLDIGRTPSREIAALAIVTQETETIVWSQHADQVVARGVISPYGAGDAEHTYSGSMAAWMLWNLSGVYLTPTTTEFGTTRVRAPFDAELPILAVTCKSGDDVNRQIIDAARAAWQESARRHSRLQKS